MGGGEGVKADYCDGPELSRDRSRDPEADEVDGGSDGGSSSGDSFHSTYESLLEVNFDPVALACHCLMPISPRPRGYSLGLSSTRWAWPGPARGWCSAGTSGGPPASVAPAATPPASAAPAATPPASVAPAAMLPPSGLR